MESCSNKALILEMGFLRGAGNASNILLIGILYAAYFDRDFYDEFYAGNEGQLSFTKTELNIKSTTS